MRRQPETAAHPYKPESKEHFLSGEEQGHPHDHSHGSAGAARENWRRNSLPFFQKFRLAAGNTWIKLRKRQRCCGHPGEPGC